MTVKDTVLVFSILAAAYPYFYRDIRNDDVQMRDTIAVWHEMLAEHDLTTVKIALKRVIAIQKDYPPTIGQLLESINIVSGHAAPDADEVWAEIINAIRSYGYTRVSEAMESLSEFARQAVNAFGWETLCKSENVEVDRAHFLRIYQAIKTRNDQKCILPKDVRAFIAAHDHYNGGISGPEPMRLINDDNGIRHPDSSQPVQSYPINRRNPCGESGRSAVEAILMQFRKPKMAEQG